MGNINQSTNFETEVLSLINNIIKEKKGILNKEGINVEILQLRRSGETAADYSSEVEIDFIDEHGIFDVLEFFIYLNGVQEASLLEIEEWLYKNLIDVIERRKSKR
jgi:hypothetical protein